MQNAWRDFTDLKRENTKFTPMLSIGGTSQGPEVWSLMARDPAKRSLFIQSLLDLSTEFFFEGYDIDWEFPGVGSGSDDAIDREDFSTLLTEIKSAFDADGRGLIVTAALSPSMCDGRPRPLLNE